MQDPQQQPIPPTDTQPMQEQSLLTFDPEAEPSDEVRQLQVMMEQAGYYVEATGVYDAETKQAVKNLARDMGDEQNQGDQVTPEMMQYLQSLVEREQGPQQPAMEQPAMGAMG